MPNLEIFGRLKEQKGYARDLSANFKYKLPIQKFIKSFPDIAIGVQDFGSAANLYEAYYIVASKDIKNFRVSIGYGHSKNIRAKRLDGIFGGIEYAINPYLIALFDYDGKEKHIAIKSITPKKWLNGISLEAILAKNLSDNSYSLGLSTKFDFYYKKETLYPKKEILNLINSNLSQKEAIDRLFKTFKTNGFNKLSIYSNKKTLLISYENNLYRNDADAIFYIIKNSFIVSKYYNKLILQPTVSGIACKNILIDLKKAITYYKNPTKNSKFITKLDNLKIENFKLLKSVEKNKLHIALSPILKTFVGTEVGVFDYQLLLGVNSYINIAKGLDISARYDFKISKSKEFDPLKGAFADSYNKGGLHSALIHYTFNLKNFINTTSFGLYRYEYLGVINQTSLQYNNHFFNLKLGYFKHKGNYTHTDWQDTKKIAIATYSYYLKNLNASIDIYGCQFWNQDRGFGINFNKYMGDITVTLKYLQTKPTTYWKFNRPENINRYVGLYLTLHLEFKKSKTNYKYIQLHGNRNFTYGLRSTIKRKSGSNQVLPGSGDIVEIPIFEHKQKFINYNKSAIDYLKSQKYRIYY